MFFVQTREKLTHGFLTFLEKYAKIMFFAIFLRNFLKVLSKFPINCVFRLNGQKWKAWFAKSFEKYAKKSIFSNFLKKFFCFFEKCVKIF